MICHVTECLERQEQIQEAATPFLTNALRAKRRNIIFLRGVGWAIIWGMKVFHF